MYNMNTYWERLFCEAKNVAWAADPNKLKFDCELLICSMALKFRRQLLIKIIVPNSEGLLWGTLSMWPY